MVLLQHKLSVKLSQRQILTPGLVQMVSVLALNKLELKDMINAEMVENPVLEELEDSVPLIDEVGRKEEDRDRLTTKTSTDEAPIVAEKKDPFEEIDFGSFFQDYLDPGYRTRSEMEDIERPSFENFLSKPTTLTDHLAWQLGALSLRREVREAAEQIIGNLNEDGYLIATDEEMLGIAPPASPEADAAAAKSIVSEAQALGLGADESSSGDRAVSPSSEETPTEAAFQETDFAPEISSSFIASMDAESNLGAPNVAQNPFEISPRPQTAPLADFPPVNGNSAPAAASAAALAPVPETPPSARPIHKSSFTRADLEEALEAIRQLDPPGVGCRELRECLLRQLHYHQQQLALNKSVDKNGEKPGNGAAQVLQDAIAIVDQHLRVVQNKQPREIAKLISRTPDAAQRALDYIRT
ncbi:MAG: hypothetical protein WBX38_20910, partial [Candidatus Sulfotelmatobacter sp.]